MYMSSLVNGRRQAGLVQRERGRSAAGGEFRSEARTRKGSAPARRHRKIEHERLLRLRARTIRARSAPLIQPARLGKRLARQDLLRFGSIWPPHGLILPGDAASWRRYRGLPQMIRSLCPAALPLALSVSVPAFADPPQERDAIPVVTTRTDDPKMAAAIAAARKALPKFLALLADPPPETGEYLFRYALGGWEHIWVDHVERRGDSLTGRLSNVPEQDGYKLGQRVTVPIGEVDDWSYRDASGVVQGSRTTRVLLPLLAPADAQSVRENMGWTR
jgi:uncharacterized protein YegJ (DUF2314 family)